MSFYKQKYFLFFLVLLINKFMFIYGGFGIDKTNITDNNYDDDYNPEEKENEIQKDNENEEIKELIPEKEIYEKYIEEEIIEEIVKDSEEKEKTEKKNPKYSEEIEETEKEIINHKSIYDEKEEEKTDKDKENEDKKEKKEEKETEEKKKEEIKEKDEKEKEKDEKKEKEEEKEEKEKEEEIHVIQQNNSSESNYNEMRYDGCGDIQPTNGVREECTERYKFVKDKSCCFMTIKYKYNNYYTCIRIEKDIKIIKPLIKELKKYYEGSNSIQIDCSSNIIKFSFLILSLFLVL